MTCNAYIFYYLLAFVSHYRNEVKKENRVAEDQHIN